MLDKTSASPIPMTFLVIAVFGAIGATFSALMGFVNSKAEARIPEHVMTTWLTWTRPFIGAVSALIVVFAIIGGVLPALAVESNESRKLAYFLLIRHSPDSRGFGARIVPLTGSGNNKSCSVRAKGD